MSRLKTNCEYRSSDDICNLSFDYYRPCVEVKQCYMEGENMESGEVRFQKFGKVGFGKFKNKYWVDIDPDYLQWLLTDECQTSPENKATARAVLKQKGLISGQFEWPGMKK